MIGFNSDIPTIYVSQSFGSQTSGSVGIGTTNIPAFYKLAVKGTIIAEEVDVRLFADWPDYVFENDYHLTPLNEIKNYYLEKKHLPGFPSASEMKQQGSISLGRITTLQQEHIEKLTIYLVEKDEEIQDLKLQISKMKNDHDEMHNRLLEIEKLLAKPQKE